MDMGAKIKQLREEKGMTLEQLGDKIGVGKSTVRKWENGMIANMRRDKIGLIAIALGVSPAYLMGWEEETPAATPDLDSPEQKLLTAFALLNELGQEEALKRVEELAELPKYRK